MVQVKPMSARTVITSPTPATRQRRSRGGTQPLPLTRDDILDAALPLVAEHGLDALTVKAVADALGISSPAVYHYVNGRDDLLDRLCERVAREIDVDIPASLTWSDTIVEVLLRMHRVFEHYPGVGARVLSTQRRSRAADRVSQKVLDVLLTEGFTSTDAMDLLATLHFLFGGWLLGTRPLRPGETLDPALLERSVHWALDGFRNTVSPITTPGPAAGPDHGDHP
jgi:AcrR family transcriptional regulator